MTPAPVSDIAVVQAAVAREFGVAVNRLTGPCRRPRVAHPRHVAMYLARVLTSSSSTAIGRRFGGRDHSMVLYAVDAVKARIREDGELAARVERLRVGLADAIEKRRAARVERHVAAAARSPISACHHLRRLGDEDPEALVAIVAAGAAVIHQTAGMPLAAALLGWLAEEMIQRGRQAVARQQDADAEALTARRLEKAHG